MARGVQVLLANEDKAVHFVHLNKSRPNVAHFVIEDTSVTFSDTMENAKYCLVAYPTAGFGPVLSGN